MPGVLTVGRCCTSLSSTYIKCVMPASNRSPQLNSTGLYNTASHSSICTALCLRSPLFFLEVLFQVQAAVERVRCSWPNMRQTPAYLRCLAGIIITVHCKHTHTCWSLCTCSTKAEELLLCPVQTQCGSQETLHGLIGIHCTMGLSWDLSEEGQSPKKAVEKRKFVLKHAFKDAPIYKQGGLGISPCLFIPLEI